MTAPRLIGPQVTLFPYLRQSAPRDMLYLLWLLIDKDGDWKRLFWDDKDEPEWTLGDLPYFVNYVHHHTDPKTWFMVVDNETCALIGAVWFSKFEKYVCGDMRGCLHKTAEGNIWMAKEHRRKAREVVQLATVEGFRQGLTEIRGTTPHTSVKNLLIKCGYLFWEKKQSIWFLRRMNYHGEVFQSAEDSSLAG